MQERVAQNLSRIEELRTEAAALEAASPSLPLPSTPLELRAPSVQPAGESRTMAVNAAARSASAHAACSLKRGRLARDGCWVPAALSSALAPHSIVAVEVEGVPWALFRNAQGQAAAIKDECAHRACPLSLVRAAWSTTAFPRTDGHAFVLPYSPGGCAGVQGKVVNGHVQCPYHGAPRYHVIGAFCLRAWRGSAAPPRWPDRRPRAGWEYEAGGACVAMPSTAFVQGVSVDALSVAEADGFVWIRPLGACQPLDLPPGLRGASALPPDYKVVAEVQVGGTSDSGCTSCRRPFCSACYDGMLRTALEHKGLTCTLGSLLAQGAHGAGGC